MNMSSRSMDNGIDIEIGSGLLTVTAEEPGIARKDWDGGDLSDGTYTIRVEVREPGGGTVWSDQESVTLDKVPPELSLGTDITEFSPNGDRVLDRLDVYYSISEDVVESQLEFLPEK